MQRIDRTEREERQKTTTTDKQTTRGRGVAIIVGTKEGGKRGAGRRTGLAESGGADIYTRLNQEQAVSPQMKQLAIRGWGVRKSCAHGRVSGK